MARTNDGLLACNMGDPSAALYKFALDGSMDELATAPALAEYPHGFNRCAVHQQTQRTYALAMGGGTLREAGRDALVLLDSNLQVVGTVDSADGDFCDAFCDVAVHGDQVIVLTGQRGLRLLDLDGRFLRTIVIRQLRSPRAVAVSDGKAFVVDEDGYEEDEDSEEDGVDEGAAFSMS